MSSNISSTADNPDDVREGRVVYVDHDEVKLSDIAIGVVIGRSSEYFTFLIFGIASVLVFPYVFFPFAPTALGMLYSFILFGLAFVARPFGSQLFSVLHTRYGRGSKLAIALFALGTSTAGIAFLPGYASIGNFAILLLVLLRICQGIAIGGSWDGLPSLLALSAPEKRRGWWAMIPQLSAPFGFIIAAGLFAWLTSQLTQEQFLAWGWRYPFYVAFALNVVAVFARMILVATPEFKQELESFKLRPAPLGALLRNHWRTIILGALAPLASYALFYLVTIFALCWAILFTNEPIVNFLVVQLIGCGIAIVTMLLSGLLADWIGRRTALGTLAGLIGVYSGWTAVLLTSGLAGGYAFILIGFALLGFCHAQAAGLLASAFPEEYRYSGAVFTSDLSWLFGAAFAPLVALLLAMYVGLDYVGIYLLSGAIATVAVLRVNRLFETRGS